MNWKVQLIGVDKGRNIIKTAQTVVNVTEDGSFWGDLDNTNIVPINEVVCLFAGTDKVGSSSSGYIVPGDTADSDKDGFVDSVDNCLNQYNPLQEDADLDGLGDVCDICPMDPDNDKDKDLICGDVDNCPNDPNNAQGDHDGDGLGDACDICEGSGNDWDGDKICAKEDNCPNDYNPDQTDTDNDGIGDVCDICPKDPENDQDFDGICESSGDRCPKDPFNDEDRDKLCADEDNCPYKFNPDQADEDGDGLGDACDICKGPKNDWDRDGICADRDNCPYTFNPHQEQDACKKYRFPWMMFVPATMKEHGK